MRTYRQEKEMYPDVCRWLNIFLNSRFKNASIEVHNLSRNSLSSYIATHNISNLPNEWVTWDIKVDIVGFIQRPDQLTSLVFAECKINQLTLSHLSQLLGYSRISVPIFSFLLSPSGMSPSLISLLQEYQRFDVLEYYWKKGERPRSVIPVKWDSVSNNVIIPNFVSGI